MNYSRGFRKNGSASVILYPNEPDIIKEKVIDLLTHPSTISHYASENMKIDEIGADRVIGI